MIPLSLAEIAAVVDGVVEGDPDLLITAPAFIDSRAAEPGGLFVAMTGDQVDGHDYARRAVEGGAAAVLGTRPVGVPAVLVGDAVAALGKLARHVVDTLTDTTVIALTGSQGKTGTKDYLAEVLATVGPTVATAGNFNNEIGVPLTVLRATHRTRFLVVEMGARGIGHIAYLCAIAPPRIAAVLNVGSAHIGEFGSMDAIALAKGEILEALPAGGVAVVSADDVLTREMAARTRARLLRFGEDGSADVTWTDVTFDDLDRPTADFVHRGQRIRQSLRQSGGFQLSNAAAAATLALAAGMDFPAAVRALGSVTATSPWRMEMTERADGSVVINDSYNANPASMEAAMAALVAIGERRGRRTVAVLGEMKELGAGSAQAHRDVGSAAARLGVQVVLTVGRAAREIAEGARHHTGPPGWSGEAIVTADRDEALTWLRENVSAGDVVLVKASRGAALEQVAAALLAEEERSR